MTCNVCVGGDGHTRVAKCPADYGEILTGLNRERSERVPKVMEATLRQPEARQGAMQRSGDVDAMERFPAAVQNTSPETGTTVCRSL